jgi:hypothetical protein
MRRAAAPIQPLMRFIRSAPPPHKPERVHSRHASAPSVIGDQADESRSAHVVSHHLDGLLRISNLGYVATRDGHGVRSVSAVLSASPGPKTYRGWESQRFPATGFTPPEESPSSVAVPHHCGRYPHDVGSPVARSEERATASRLRRDRSRGGGASTSTESPCRRIPNAPKHAVHVCRSTHGPPR